MPTPEGLPRGLDQLRALAVHAAGQLAERLQFMFLGAFEPAVAVAGGGAIIARSEATVPPGAFLPGFTTPVRLKRRARRETAAPAAPAAVDADQAEIVALIHAAQAKDMDAFAGLYERYGDLVYRYVYFRVGSQQLAEDVVSETFLRALRRIDSFTWQGRDFGAWLVTIARNIVADHYKSSRFRLEVTTADMLDSDRLEESPENSVLKAFTNVALIEAVKQLGPEQQECIVLRFLQGLSVAETARIMGRNEGAVKALQYRAVRALGRLIPDDLR